MVWTGLWPGNTKQSNSIKAWWRIYALVYWVITGSGNGLSPDWCQFIVSTKLTLEKKSMNIQWKYKQFLSGNCSWKLSAKRGPFVPTPRGPFYYHGLTLIPAWISNFIHCKLWYEIIYPFPNFNGCTVEVWKWISNFISHFAGHVITYPWWD